MTDTPPVVLQETLLKWARQIAVECYTDEDNVTRQAILAGEFDELGVVEAPLSALKQALSWPRTPSTDDAVRANAALGNKLRYLGHYDEVWPLIDAYIAALCIDRTGLDKGEEDGRVLDLEPWANYHGELPDYDHPLRPVYESGIQYAVELLAKELGVEHYEVCDGTEEFDGDLGGTMLNIVRATWPTDEHGDWLDLRDPQVRASLAPNPSPSPDQDKGDAVKLAEELADEFEAAWAKSTPPEMWDWCTENYNRILTALRQSSPPVLDRDAVLDAREALRPFLDIRHNRQSWKIINRELGSMEPVTVTVTKAQLLSALGTASRLDALLSTSPDTGEGGECCDG